tara:strand:- start:283 stop:738 length:456 start_codon:yes stop_codon:yes gene_type:complete
MKIGERCPEIAYDNQHGKSIPFKDFLGSKNIVFFFYPKNFTPGCTKEACVFRDSYEEFQQYDCEVIGISSDSEKSHRSFSNAFNLNYHLIADRKETLRDLFEVPKNLFGLVPGRVTFVIDKKGICIGIFNSLINSKGHISYALNCLKEHNQ